MNQHILNHQVKDSIGHEISPESNWFFESVALSPLETHLCRHPGRLFPRGWKLKTAKILHFTNSMTMSHESFSPHWCWSGLQFQILDAPGTILDPGHLSWSLAAAVSTTTCGTLAPKILNHEISWQPYFSPKSFLGQFLCWRNFEELNKAASASNLAQSERESEMALPLIASVTMFSRELLRKSEISWKLRQNNGHMSRIEYRDTKWCRRTAKKLQDRGDGFATGSQMSCKVPATGSRAIWRGAVRMCAVK